MKIVWALCTTPLVPMPEPTTIYEPTVNVLVCTINDDWDVVSLHQINKNITGLFRSSIPKTCYELTLTNMVTSAIKVNIKLNAAVSFNKSATKVKIHILECFPELYAFDRIELYLEIQEF
jgi:hypothetical protein